MDQLFFYPINSDLLFRSPDINLSTYYSGQFFKYMQKQALLQQNLWRLICVASSFALYPHRF